jgi:hypothetical protein
MESNFYGVFSQALTGQAVAVGAWLPIIILVALLLVIVFMAYRGMQKNTRKPLIRPRTPARTLSERNEELKRNLADMQAHNAAELAQTRAILDEARAEGNQVVRETREGVIEATREETRRARADIIKVRDEQLAELRREGNRLGQDEPPRNGNSNPPSSR